MEQTAHPADEIDFLNLFRNLLAFLLRESFRLGISLVIGLVLGITLYYTTPSKYESNMTLHPLSISNTELVEITDHWSRLLNAGEYQLLAKEWDLPAEVVFKLKNITVREVGGATVADGKKGFVITVSVTDNAILPALQQGMMHAIDENPYLKERTTLQRENFQTLIQRAQKEITELEQFKNRVDSQQGAGRSNASNRYIVDISGINDQLISLNEKLVGYQEELKYAKPVQLFQGFTPYNNATSPKLKKMLLLGVAIGIAIWILLLAIRWVRTINLK